MEQAYRQCEMAKYLEIQAICILPRGCGRNFTCREETNLTMCAPTKDLVKIAAIAAVAYASGGSSLFASGTAAAGTTASTAALSTTSLAIPTTVYGQTAAASGFNFAGMFSTLSSFAKIATPVIGAAGTIYQGVMNAELLKQKAGFVDYSITQDMEASALREIRRRRSEAEAIGKQRARYSVTGVSLEGTPTDILEETSAKFAEDQFLDDFMTSQKMYSKQISAEQLRQEAKSAQLGGFVNAAVILGGRGLTPSNPVKPKSLLDGAGSYADYSANPTGYSGPF